MLDSYLENLENVMRQDRNAMLAESDFIVLRAYESGSQVPQAWVDYRQALRDITTHPRFPEGFPWPVKPE
jgi:hypothetical protein